jgi:carboxypeptidase Q
VRLAAWNGAVAILLATAAAAPAAGQSAPFVTMDSKIRAEEAAHSKLMRTEHILTDVYGPRLTASPNALAAGKWALRQMASWGLSKGHLEPWVFGHPGWTNLSATGFIASPTRAQLDLRVVAWTRGTNGEVRARATFIDPPRKATRAQLMRYLESVRDRVRGKIVLVGPSEVETDEPFPPRFSDQKMEELLRPVSALPEAPADPNILKRAEWSELVNAFLVGAGARMRVDDAQRPHGMIIAYANWTYEPSKAPPWVVLRHEDYGRIVRLLADGPATLGFDIRNRLSDGRFAYNAVAEIPGRDLKDQLVIIGAHLDSWHAATGAIDDGVGCAMMMEAMRILKTLDVHPRRTIRIVLWTGEEQGLYGSQAYVAEHFGTAEAPKPDFDKLAAYINIDGGTGRVRAANIFGPPADADMLAAALSPFADLGVKGAVAHGIRKLRSTDATTFSRAGLPAIGLIQDPIEYGNVQWHSNLDTYDAVLEDDANAAAVVIAGLVYNLAMRDDAPARFAPAEMPKPDGPAPSTRPVTR